MKFKLTKIKIFTIFSYILLSSCSDTKIEYYPDGTIKSEIEKMDGGNKIIGRWYHPNGALMNQLNYINGEKEGLSKTYFDNGKLDVVVNYENGVLNGEYKDYYKSGGMKTEFNYKLGKQEGVYKSYYTNQQLKLSALCENDYKFYSVEYDSLGVWKDEYREVKVFIDDTVVLEKNYLIKLELKGPKISMKDSVLCSFSVYLVDEKRIVQKSNLFLVDGNSVEIEFNAKEIGFYGCTGMFLTNKKNEKRKHHQITSKNFHIIDKIVTPS